MKADQDGLRMISNLDPQIDGRNQCVKICFVALMGLPYETLYQSSTYLQQPKLE